MGLEMPSVRLAVLNGRRSADMEDPAHKHMH